MKSFSKAFERIGTENAFAVGPEISACEKVGYDIIRLNLGEPCGNIDSVATRAAISSLKKHETHYTPSAGCLRLREKIADYMTITRGVKFGSSEINLTPGGKAVITGVVMILVNPGDEVIYPTPGYPIYESAIDFVGAKAKPILLREENDFRLDVNELEKLITKKTKLLILNSPSNPTGGVLTKNDLKRIATLIKKHDLFVLSDEIYSRMAYDGECKRVKFMGKTIPITPSIISFPGMIQRTIILDGFSKTYSMTGLRIGYAACKNEDFMKKFLTYAINFWSCLPQPCMSAAEAVLSIGQENAQKEIAQYKKKRDYMVRALNKIKGVSCKKPQGAFYLFPNVTKVCKNLKLKNAESLRKYLLTYDKENEKGVAVLTREHFGRRLKKENQEYIRISIAGPLEDLKEGLARIKEAVEV